MKRIVAALVLVLVGAPLALGASFLAAAQGSMVSSGTGSTSWAAPGPIGTTTPNTIVGTQIFAVNGAAAGTSGATFGSGGNTFVPAIVTNHVGTFNVNQANYSFSNSANFPAFIYFLRAKGTEGTPTAVVAGNVIGTLTPLGYDGTSYAGPSQGLSWVARGTISTGVVPMEMDLGSETLTGNAGTRLAINPNGNLTFTRPANLSTDLTASTEQVSYNFNDSASMNFPTGDFAKQRGTLFQAPTYTAVGASTITAASTVTISNAPTCNSNMTCTNAYALNVEAGVTNLAGGLKITDAGAISVSSSTTGTASVSAAASCVCSVSTADAGGKTLKSCDNGGTTTLTATLSGSGSATIQYFCHL